ncbi:hypothetical protein FNB79_12335 [Formosa sediminum]|uniref:Uncharacterized protein n=1 Tax=Formosa sediminum TaxID=2594004 RepID=A0A516GT68_9FLAO|nr:DUF6660 family protein [Formosa sediminum]QDO94716.1 hypothetical protein FNB79_12335 [Formosa sediminum]
MKFLTLLFSVYVLALNFAPCQDNVSLCSDCTTKISQHSDTDQDHKTSDDCSPFCQCQCCHIHIVQFNVIEVNFYIPDIYTKQFLHFDSHGKDYVQTLLQPPRV